MQADMGEGPMEFTVVALVAGGSATRRVFAGSPKEINDVSR
jgi:hypothetical protein